MRSGPFHVLTASAWTPGRGAPGRLPAWTWCLPGRLDGLPGRPACLDGLDGLDVLQAAPGRLDGRQTLP